MSIITTGVLRRVSVTAGPPPPPLVPLAPGSVTAVVNLLAVTGSYTDLANNESGFRIEKTVNSGATWTLHSTPGPLAGTGLTGSFSDTLLPDQRAQYRVRAEHTTNGNSAYVLSPIVLSTPNAPTLLALNGAVAPGDVPLTMVDNSNIETGFELERAPDVAGAPGVFAKIGADRAAKAGTGAYNFSDATVAATSTYHFRARAKVAGGGGNSAYTNVLGPITTPAATGVQPISMFVHYKDVGYSITVDARASYDPDGVPLVSRTLDWGDGTIVSHPTLTRFTHVYSGAGPYNVTLTVQKSDGQTRAFVKAVYPKLDRSPDFEDTFATGTWKPSPAGAYIFYRSPPSNVEIVSSAFGPTLPGSNFCERRQYPALPHGSDNGVATEHRMGCAERMNEWYEELMVWFPDGTEPWGPNRFFHRTQLGRNVTGCSINAGSSIMQTTSINALVTLDDGGGFSVIKGGATHEGKIFSLGAAYQLPGTFASDGAGNLTGTGTDWATRLTPGTLLFMRVSNKDRMFTVVSIASNTSMKIGTVATAVGGGALPGVGTNLTAEAPPRVVSCDNSSSPALITLSKPAINTVSNVTGKIPDLYAGDNNKWMILWDNNSNYSGDVNLGHEFEPYQTPRGDARMVFKPHVLGASAAGVTDHAYGVTNTFTLISDATRGRWVNLKIAGHFSEDKTVPGQWLAMLDDVIVVDQHSAANRVLCADPRGFNWFSAWYLGGWCNSGFNHDMEWYCGLRRYWSIRPAWHPGWR